MANTKTVARALAKKKGISVRDAKKDVDAVLECMWEVLKEDPSLTLRGYGRIDIYARKGRMGRIPQSGEQIYIKETISARFESKALKKHFSNEKGLTPEGERMLALLKEREAEAARRKAERKAQNKKLQKQ